MQEKLIISQDIINNKGRTINDLGGGPGQRIRVEFFFPRQLAVELFLLGCCDEFFFPAFARAPQIVNGPPLSLF